jgi:hypothetical protein
MPSQDDRFNALLERLDADGEVAGALELDAVTTLRDLGFDDLVATAEQERDRIGELVDRIYRDASFREAVEQDPLGELGGWGVPEIAIAPVLVLAGAPDDVVERATSDVEAHLLGKKPATVAAMGAILGTLAFAQQATAAQPQATMQTNPAATAQVTAQVTPATTAQVTPATTAQVTPSTTAQVNPATTAQVNPQTKSQVNPATEAQVTKAQRATWQGIQASRIKAQGQFSQLLRAYGGGL